MSLDTGHYWSPLVPDNQRAMARNTLAHAFWAARGYNGDEASADRLIESLRAFEECARELAGGSSLDRDTLESAVSAQMLHSRQPVTVTSLLDLAIENFGRRFDANNLNTAFETSYYFLPTARNGEIVTGSGTGVSPVQFEPRTRQLILALNRNGIYADDLIIYRGIVRKWALREHPYNLIHIPRLNREVAICDQVGEAAFVSEGLRGPRFWAEHSKEQLTENAGVTRVAHISDWVSRIVGLLLDKNSPGPKIIILRGNKLLMKEEGWLPYHKMSSVYVGGHRTFKRLLESYLAIMRDRLVDQGKTSEDAAAEADQHVGMRFLGNGTGAICASPAVIAELERAGRITHRNKQPAKKEAGWLTANELESVYIGNHIQFRGLLETYAEKKRHGMIEEGKTPEEAAAEVDRHVGIRSVWGRFPTICASPAVIAELEQRGRLRQLYKDAPKKEPDWLSNKRMSRIYIGADYTFKPLLESYAESMRQKLMAQGKTPEEAVAEVDKYVGIRTTAGGNPAICASPTVVAELEQTARLRPLNKKAPPKDTSWLSIPGMRAVYVDNAPGFLSLLESYADSMRQKLMAQGKTPEEAVAEVDKHVGIRTVRHRKEAICASPEALAELEQKGKLQRREAIDAQTKRGNSTDVGDAVRKSEARRPKARVVTEPRTPSQ